MKVMKTLVLAVLVVAFAAPAFAQQVDIRATPPPPQERPPDFVTPGPYYDVSEPRENQWYPEGVRVPYDPAFIAPLSEEYETTTTRGRYGVAGWSSQNLPVGAPGTMYREQAGWLSFGFAFTWGAPPRPPASRTAPAARPTPAPSR
jgi:hypothetical protein